MKKAFFALLGCLLASPLLAQTNASARLAIVAESADAAAVADVLTAEFSTRENLQLLERNEIEKIYREQGLAAGGKDYLKLGQVLGADGLLLLETAKAGTNQFLNVRLVAVKPGVVLLAEKFSGLADGLVDWASVFAKHLQPLLPKLAVLPKDAVPVSVVNLRSSVASVEAAETERQLQTLVIQRLSREPQLFVLERQKLQQLGEEKSLSADESKFWSGAWLLEGVVDQNGFSKDTLTINARLTSAQGGAVMPIEVAGSRTNFAGVINQLAVKITAALAVTPVVKEWNAADEAAQFYAEANWALGWGVFAEAQAAADAAWALGKQDLECATVRIKARTGQVPLVIAPNVTMFQNGRRANYVHINEPPELRHCDTVLQALNCYYEFCRSSPAGEPKILTRGPGWSDWHNSEWYGLGIETLETASRELQHFNYVVAAQKPAADKLAELRAQTRRVAEFIFQSPSVHDSYFSAGSRVESSDALYRTIQASPNIFSCMLNWGGFWQEQPEDTVALYQRLIASPVFCYLHGSLWSRDPLQPRLVAWDAEGRQRIPRVWGNFIGELNVSTNLLWRLEGRALALKKIQEDSALGLAFTNFFEEIFSNRAEIVANPAGISDQWDVEALLAKENPDGIYSEARDVLSRAYYSNFSPKLEQMKQEYERTTVPAAKASSVFEDQKKFLRANQPYEFMVFNSLFEEKNYSPAQAQEILPLIIAYKSNLLAQAELADRGQKFQLQADAHSVEFFLQRSVEKILHPQPPLKPPVRAAQTSPPPRPVMPVKVQEEIAETPTNVILVKKFLEIPLDKLEGEISQCLISAHHWQEGRLVLDLSCSVRVYSFEAKGNWTGTRNATRPAIAILDPDTEQWNVIACPEIDIGGENRFYHHTTFWRGDVFTSDGNQIRKYDTAKKSWQGLEIPDVGNCELFTVNDHLYAATGNLIVEILNGGSGTHILASNRRQPPMSALDRENLGGTPTLFAGPGNSLRVATASKIFSWNGTDWNEVCPAPHAPLPPVISNENILFLADGWNAPAGIWRLMTTSNQVEFCLGQERATVSPGMNSVLEKKSSSLWKLPPEVTLQRNPVAVRGADLFLLTDHAKMQDIVNEKEHVIAAKKILPQEGYHAALFCFASDFPSPQKLFLKFDDVVGAAPPVTGEQRSGGFMLPGVPVGWMCIGEGRFFLGREFTDQFGGSWSSYFPKAGVWVIDQKQIDSEITRQKAAQQTQQAAATAQTRQVAKSFLEKYDLNHNGQLDPDEREPALDNEAFIQSELSLIDTNHNGWLEASELIYFDANQNKILEPKEVAGIGIAQRLLAEKLLKEFDHSGTSGLNRQDFSGMIESTLHVNPNGRPDLRFEDQDNNHDQRISQEELEFFLQQRTQSGLRSRGISSAPLFTRMGMGGRMEPDRERLLKASLEQLFKASVESYWQNPDGTNGRRSFEP